MNEYLMSKLCELQSWQELLRFYEVSIVASKVGKYLQ